MHSRERGNNEAVTVRLHDTSFTRIHQVHIAAVMTTQEWGQSLPLLLTILTHIGSVAPRYPQQRQVYRKHGSAHVGEYEGLVEIGVNVLSRGGRGEGIY